MFAKTGQSQPFSVSDDKCQVCHERKASVSVDGKMVCAECSQQQQQQEKQTNV